MAVYRDSDDELRQDHSGCLGKAPCQAPIAIERESLARATCSREYFIARIHGSAEVPSSIVFDAQGYSRIGDDINYIDFLMDVFRRRSVLFVGFSFLDPAIEHVLKVYIDRHGPGFEMLHTAILPHNEPDLAARLRSANIEVIQYDPVDNHVALWRGIREAYGLASAEHPGRVVAPAQLSVSTSATHRFLAFAYAQSTTRKDAAPVSIIAYEGVVASILATQGQCVVDVGDIVPEVAKALGFTLAEAGPLVGNVIDRLERRRVVERHESLVQWVGGDDNTLEIDLGYLVQAVVDRMRIRDGIVASDGDRTIASHVLEELLIARAWDMAAQLAGAGVSWPSDLDHQISASVATARVGLKEIHEAASIRAILNLLRVPDGEESTRLTSLARVAFGVQLLLASPRQTLLHTHALPQRIYLDSNIVLPLIASGHPLRPAYQDALMRLATAAQAAGTPLQVVVGNQFLNEVVSHRDIAVRMVADLDLEEPERLGRHIAYHGAINTNVFIGAYATFVGRQKDVVGFDEYLRKFAPYTSEEQLAKYLQKQGIGTVDLSPPEERQQIFIEIRNALESAYENSGDAPRAGRARVLLIHEAQQLARLSEDVSMGLRSLFVTAHGRFRRVVRGDPRMRELNSQIMSHIGLVALAEVFAGGSTDSRALARLLWTVPAVDSEATLFEYFVDAGLRKYREGLSGDITRAASKAAEEARRQAESEKLQFVGDSVEDIARTAQFLDRFEDRFYELYRQGVERSGRGAADTD
ncbi:MAG: SIR2 family protein [bacterium]|nr:SIR2 family protein [bacterium]